MEEIVTQYYLRFAVLDQPGVLAQISSVLGRYDISISSMIQPERQESGAVPIVIMTHEATEARIRGALAEIDQLEVVREPSHFIRIESDME
jgi:homoserine dehydrogenase